MKKMFGVLLVLMMLFSGAFAETAEIEGALQLVKDEWVETDLDGDGANERVLVRMEGVEDESFLQLAIEGSDGAVDIFDTFIAYTSSYFAMDLDGDGRQEILLSGDAASEDYFTWCLNYDVKTGVTPVTFADANRGVNTGEYFEEGYGRIVAMNGNTVTLRGSQDVLGTWMAERSFTLKDGRFELEDGGLWVMEDITWDEFIWEYYCLNPVKDVPVTFGDGSEGVLTAGEKFVITRSDKVSVAEFVTQDGKTGSIALTENIEEGWGHMIAGVADYEYFEYMPYAD